MKKTLLIDVRDNLAVALSNLKRGQTVQINDHVIELVDDIPQKHKFSLVDLDEGKLAMMYGVVVGKTTSFVPAGGLISTENLTHHTAAYNLDFGQVDWEAPDVSAWRERSFMGYHRSDGEVGTANHWLIIPLVFCENRNVDVLRETFQSQLGYAVKRDFRFDISPLIDAYQSGEEFADNLQRPLLETAEAVRSRRPFANIDGIKFLNHDGGCGCTREDASTLAGLLAGYITHPNTAGATILSLGCQGTQIANIKDEITKRSPGFDRPVLFFEQQGNRSEHEFLENVVRETFAGLVSANNIVRKPAPLSKITLGLECGGSDGFSGLTANPALGYASDLLVALGGRTVLAEFPELNGVEQELINRCHEKAVAEKFAHLMNSYHERARAIGSGFESNPSPGNIRDGLITDAIKSAGAAKKGGTSPVCDVLDYTERATKSGLNLLCTPGGDVESTTGLAGCGANVIVFTTGLGTPTGNVVTPVLKMSTNSDLFHRMKDIIDIDAGGIILGEETLESKGEELLDLIIRTASGAYTPAAVRLGQDDFIPWKRGISL